MNAPSRLQKTRRFDLDWLRIFGVLLLVPFHAALIFYLNPMAIMYVKDTVNSDFLGQMTWFISLFFMPLLFAISGAATCLALGFRSPGQYLRERVQRLLVPAAFAIIVLIPPMTYLTRLARGETISFWQHFTGFFRLNPNDLAGYAGTLTPAHIWFIVFLFVFSVIGLPFFLLERREKNRRISAKIAGFFEKRFALYLLLIPLALAASVNLLGDKNPVYYFGIFCLGYLVLTDSRYTPALDRDAPASLLMGLLLAGLTRVWNPHFSQWSLAWVGYGLLEQGVRLFLLLGILGLGHRFLQRGGEALSYLNEAAFPFYILHLPLVTLVGYFAIRLNAVIAVKYLLVVALSYLLTFGVYELCKRIPVVRNLLGMKIRPGGNAARPLPGAAS